LRLKGTRTFDRRDNFRFYDTTRRAEVTLKNIYKSIDACVNMKSYFTRKNKTTNDEETPKEDTTLLVKNVDPLMEEARLIPKYIAKELPELKNRVLEGNAIFRLLAFLAGLFMTILSFIDFFSGIVGTSKADIVISVYTFVFGIIICLLEGRSYICSARLRSASSFYVRIFNFTWGRGMLYILAGFTQLSQTSKLDILNSYFTISIGFMFILGSYTASDKLKNLREKLYNKELLIKSFKEFSKNQGYLTSSDFANMCGRLGLQLTYHELIISFENLDKDDDKKITLEEFQAWWRQSGTEYISLESLI